ncbi:MAG: TonB-dependent siderophore receptor [Gammaproteobacteria bacterium]|nr:TonB-dependent siderophore receptor [Gammaproteobacteria bacterium]
MLLRRFPAGTAILWVLATLMFHTSLPLVAAAQDTEPSETGDASREKAAGPATDGEAGAEDATDGAATTLEMLVVTGRRIDHYSATDALTGTKTNALLRDLPVTVSVVPHQLVEDRAMLRLGEALDNVAGAQRKQGYGGVENFGAFLRGFDSSFLTLRNGIRDFGFYTLRDVANVERFEVLKGPGSVLYGAVYPGGITNTITKKPVAEPMAEIRLITGSEERYRAEADLGGPVSDSVFYRLNMAYEDLQSFRDEVGSNGYFLAPVVTWVASDRTRLTVEVEHKNSEYTWDLGLPRSPLSLTLPIERFLGEPDGINDVDSTYVNTRLEHELTEQWTFRQVLGHARTNGDYSLRSAWRVGDDNRTASRVAYDTWERSKTAVAQHELAGNFESASISHTFVGGVEYYETEQAYSFFFSSLAPIDLFEPVYGAQPQPGGFVLFADQNNSEAIGVYAQDLIAIGERWKLLAGLRYDRVENSTTNLLNGQVTEREPDKAWSPQLGIVFQPDGATSIHLSYGESFRSITSGRTADGSDLEPETGQQVEIGIRREWLDGLLASSFSIYDIKRQNVATPDPLMPTFRVQTGEQSSRGFEIELSGSPAAGWDLIASAAYIDGEVSRDNRFEVGSRLPGAPRNSASVWGKYTIQAGELAGLELAVGAYYVGGRAGALPNLPWELPSYTRIDGMVARSFGDWRVQLNLKNLADRVIYDLTSTSIMPQEPRSALLRISRLF